MRVPNVHALQMYVRCPIVLTYARTLATFISTHRWAEFVASWCLFAQYDKLTTTMPT